MNRMIKIWLIVAGSLFAAGALIFVTVMTAVGWDFSRLSTVKYETNEYGITEDYDDVAITTDTADIEFVLSADGKTEVVCYEAEKFKHSVSVKDGTLTVEPEGVRGWGDHIGIDFNTPKITVYLPRAEYGSLTVKSDTGSVKMGNFFTLKSLDVTCGTGDAVCSVSVFDGAKIKCSTGDITLEGCSVGSLSLAVSTGSISVSGVSCAGDADVTVSTGRTKIEGLACKSFTSSGNTGDLSMKGVIASEAFDIKRTTGDVTFDGCDAADITVSTGTGDVMGTLCTSKVFTAKTGTGRVVLPDERTGGACRITTSTGNIIIVVE